MLKNKQTIVAIERNDSNKEYLDRNSVKEKYRVELTQWELADQNTYRAQGHSSVSLPSDFYTIGIDGFSERPIFKRLGLVTDDLVKIPNGISEEVLLEIDDFWKREDKFNKLGFLHYRGYMFYGLHGSGKTCLVHLINRDVIRKGGIVFICKDPNDFIKGVREFRSIEPDRKIVCVFEDIEAIVRTYGEEKILSFLDGEYKINKVLNIATTNYPELLDKRIVGRPRRFDRIIKIGYPDYDSRKVYLETKLSEKEAIKWAKETEGLSFASLAELVISVKCLDKTFDDVMEILKAIQFNEASSIEQSEIGFGDNEEEKPQQGRGNPRRVNDDF